MKAVWNNQVIAESNKTIVVENNHYFPMESVKKEFLESSSMQTTCPWKGKAHYYNVVVDGKVNNNAAWVYPEPKEEAKHIKNYIAFWQGVEVTE